MKTTIFLIFFVFLVLRFCNAQTNQWTWIKGDSIQISPGFHGIKGVPNVLNNPGTRSSCKALKDVSGNFWLFGGSCENGPSNFGRSNELWKYNSTTNEWTWVSGDSLFNKEGVYSTKGISSATNMPGSRSGCAGWADQAGKLWIFGGFGYGVSSIRPLMDLWKYDPITNEWTFVNGDSTIFGQPFYGIKEVSNQFNRPGLRTPSCTWMDTNGNMWLFGGSGYINPFNSEGLLNDLWKYNPTINQWVWMKGDNAQGSFGVYGSLGVPAAANKPGARRGSMSWVDAAGNFWMFGGGGNAFFSVGYLNDMWKYDVATNNWIWIKGDSIADKNGIYGVMGVADPSNQPGGRSGSQTWTDNDGNFWLMGGFGKATGNNSGALNDLWKFNTATYNWEWISGDSVIDANTVYGIKGVASPTNKPGKRVVAASWVDNAGKFYLFGGTGSTGTGGYNVLNDLWTFLPSSSIPVHLLSFSGKLRSKTIELQWTSDNEQNFSHYEIERSNNSNEWNKVGAVKWKGRSDKNEYRYADDLSRFTPYVSRLLYRLKMIDKDGSFTYSNIVNIRLSNQASFSIYPNPATTSVQLQFDKSMNERVQVQLLDMNGKVVVSGKWLVVSGVTRISTSKLAAGSYVVKVKVANDNDYSKKLVLKK